MSDDRLDAREVEMDVLLARAELVVPPERRAGLLAAFSELRSMVALVHVPRTAEAASVSTFSPEPRPDDGRSRP